jgi:hypothetical protein
MTLKRQILIATLSLGIFLVSPSRIQAATYYVSRTGNNSNGLSWSTAWSELNQIDWSVVNPGDTIELDGGRTSCQYPVTVTETSNNPLPTGCGQIYTTPLSIAKSGTNGSPITVRLSRESGHNGTARIYGGRVAPLPYCGNNNYSWQTTGVQVAGIKVDGQSYVTVDGTKWAGIMIYGHNRNGIYVQHKNYLNQHHLTFKNMEIFDNGTGSGGKPNQEGVYANGSDFTFEKLLVHDNGQDAFQTCHIGIFNNITIKNSWLYNQRPHPNKPNDTFNECTHSDGVQYCSEGTSSGLTVENSIIGPGFMNGFILGYFGQDRNSKINNVIVRNSLLVSHHGDSANSGLIVPSFSYSSNNLPEGYQLDHVTIVRDINTCVETGQPAGKCLSAVWEDISLHGSGHSITNSLFYGGTSIDVTGNPLASNNYNWRVADSANIATEANPLFKDIGFDGVQGDPTSPDTKYADFDFTITNPDIPFGVGSSITSVASLIGDNPIPQSSNSTPLPTSKPGDINGDGKVDIIDVGIAIDNYGKSNLIYGEADINHDGVINVIDIGIITDNYTH